MVITKFGHCCLLVEVAGKRILIDPGRFSEQQHSLTDIDIILITHEHADHYHSDSVSELMKHNPEATIVTNSSVAHLLTSLELRGQVLEGTAAEVVKGISLKAYDGKHVEIVGEFGIVQNTGYLVNDRFFFPGDAYTVPEESVDILALPVAGPWCKVSDAIVYAKQVAPRVAFPVHDATLSEIGKNVTYPHFERELPLVGTLFTVLEITVPTQL